MNDDAPSLPIASAVFAGAVILVGVPVMALTSVLLGELLAVSHIADSLGSAASTTAFLAVFVASILIGLQFAYEAAALQLHGTEALNRGSRLATIVRHTLLSLGVVVALAGATWIGLSTVLESERLWLAAPGAVVAIAGLVVALRSVGVFANSYRGQGRS